MDAAAMRTLSLSIRPEDLPTPYLLSECERLFRMVAIVQQRRDRILSELARREQAPRDARNLLLAHRGGTGDG